MHSALQALQHFSGLLKEYVVRESGVNSSSGSGSSSSSSGRVVVCSSSGSSSCEI